MARHFLTDAACRTATVPEGAKLAKLNDGEGLFLLVVPVKPLRGRPRKDAPKVTKRWRFAYRFGGRQNTLALGDYPTVMLAFAREKAEEARKLLADGTDPSAKRKAGKKTAAVAHLTTFNAVADEWLEKRRPLCSAVTHDKLTWLLSLVRPTLGSMQVAAIVPADVVTALKPTVARGLRDTARRCRANLSRIFNYAALHGLCTADPAAPLARNDEVLPPPVVQHHAAITDKREGDRDGDAAARFGALLRAIDGYEGNRSVRNALNLIALVACRPGELRAMRWSWVTLDGDCPRIDFPAGAMKMREDFEVPLSKQAVAILTEQRGMTAWSDFVFPAVAPQSSANRPVLRSISETTLNAALRRLGFLHDQHVAHGFRSSFSSLANQSKIFDADTIEAAMAHTVPGVRGVYLRSAFTPERRTLAAWWGNRCDEMREQRPSNIVALPRVAS